MGDMYLGNVENYEKIKESDAICYDSRGRCQSLLKLVRILQDLLNFV